MSCVILIAIVHFSTAGGQKSNHFCCSIAHTSMGTNGCFVKFWVVDIEGSGGRKNKSLSYDLACHTLMVVYINGMLCLQYLKNCS